MAGRIKRATGNKKNIITNVLEKNNEVAFGAWGGQTKKQTNRTIHFVG